MHRHAGVKAIVGIVVVIVAATAIGVQTQGRGAQARPAPSAPATVTAIRAGRLFDSKAGTMLTNQVVLISGDRITDVGPSVQVPAGARVIDLSNATVLPGMIDMHVHLVGQGSLPTSTLIALEAAQRGLNAGFTTMARHELASELFDGRSA